MDKNAVSVSDVLTEIIGVAIEYDLHVKPNRFINLMDLYSRYLLTRPNNTGYRKIGAAETTAGFYQFICSQPLLDSAALATEMETGEPMMAPTALRPRNSGDTRTNPKHLFGANRY